MKRILLPVLLLLTAALPVWASTDAVFTSVAGKIEVKDAKGKITRPAQKDATVTEGERIVAGADGNAVLQLFDGSELTVSPNTDFTLQKLQKAGLKDKVFRFKLELGRLLAKVKKLASSKSSFEVEAGGVVCGVRGTEFLTAYNSQTGKVDVFVFTGTVYTQVGQQIQDFLAGHGGTYVNGNWTLTSTPPGTNPPPQSNGNPSPGFISSNPFYGFNGTGSDNFNIPLSDPTGGINGITNTIDNNGVADLGAHTILSLQLGFPQYLP